jgi:hypothetical protein
VTDHPYRSQPDRSFWSRAVARGFDATSTVLTDGPVLRYDDLIVSAGSCFASNLVPYLEDAGFTYLRTEQPHPLFAEVPENLGYRNFSAAYGNIYTARQLRQLLERAQGRFVPAEDRWHVDGHVIDPFRPGLRYPARSDAEFDALTRQHLDATLEAFERATAFVFTLGLTEAWESSLDGAVYPACPGTIAGTFDPERHRFHNFGVDEVRDDLIEFITAIRSINPTVRFVLTVSPVPLVATATAAHVLVATAYSKSVLRVAADQVAAAMPGITYFPAYEIVSGPQAPDDFYDTDRREVTPKAVGVVMNALLAVSERRDDMPALERNGSTPIVRIVERDSERLASSTSVLTGQLIAAAECDEMMADQESVAAI